MQFSVPAWRYRCLTTIPHHIVVKFGSVGKAVSVFNVVFLLCGATADQMPSASQVLIQIRDDEFIPNLAILFVNPLVVDDAVYAASDNDNDEHHIHNPLKCVF